MRIPRKKMCIKEYFRQNFKASTWKPIKFKTVCRVCSHHTRKMKPMVLNEQTKEDSENTQGSHISKCMG